MVVIAAFATAVAATPVAMWIARRTGVLDHPGDLKVQTRAVPYLGGLGVGAGVAVGAGAARPAVLIPLGLALALGVVDDARHIRPVTRLAAEVAVGLAAAAVVPVRLPGVLGVAAVTVAVVLVVNGVNMIDGLDGLAAGVAAVSALGFALVLDGDDRSVALALAAALAGFLVFNRPPAKVYLGDGGAYLIGAALAVLLALAWSEDRPLAHSLGALPLVACPVAELAFSVVRRARSRSPLFAGDRSHVYDQLVQRGRSPSAAAGTYVVAQAVLAAAAVGAARLPPVAAAAVAGACAVALASTVAALGFLSPTSPETAA